MATHRSSDWCLRLSLPKPYAIQPNKEAHGGLALFMASVHIVNMSDDFACPRCQARYRIVRIKCESGATHQMLQCVVCEQSMEPTEGDDILKYFLVSPRKKSLRQIKDGPSL